MAGASLCAAAFADDKAGRKTDGLWRGSGGAALSATSGNTSTTSVLLDAEAQRATTQDKLTLSGTINYARGKTGGVRQTTANKWSASGEYEFNLSPRVFAFGKLGFSGDKLIALTRRTAIAGGLGYKLIDTPATTWDLFGGLGHTNDRYSVAQTVRGRTGTSFSRSNLYLGEASSHQLTATTSFKQRLDLYPGVSGDKALLAKFTAGLSVAMSRGLSLTVGLTNDYNSRPPAGRKSNDLGLFTGINVKFGAV